MSESTQPGSAQPGSTQPGSTQRHPLGVPAPGEVPRGAVGGNVALVTGAASGIGRATAEILLERGACVVGLDLPSADASWLAAHERAIVVTGDATVLEDNERAVAAALEHFGSLDSALFNAGISGHGDIETMDLDVARRILDINLMSAVLGLRAVTPAMRRGGGGSIVCVSSVTGLGGEPQRWAYGMAKAGIINLVKSMAVDLAMRGIRVNGVCPGPVSTGMTTRLETTQPERADWLRGGVALQRWGNAREVGEVIAFLLSPLASFVTGVSIPVDGGISTANGQTRPPTANPEGLPE